MSNEVSATQSIAAEHMRTHVPDQWKGTDEKPNTPYRPNGWDKPFEESVFNKEQK